MPPRADPKEPPLPKTATRPRHAAPRPTSATSAAETVCITGTSRYWGERLARKIEGEGKIRSVIGLDTERPSARFRNVRTFLVDFKDPSLVDLLRRERVKTAVHLYFVPKTRRSEMAFQDNVLGTMNFLSACAKAGVRKIVFKSSARVYGARADNPLYLREDRFLRADPVFQYTRDLLDIELYANGFRRRHPKITFTTLRFCGVVGPTAKSPWTLYLRERLVPTLLGFDPLVQVVHEDDVLEVLHHATKGTYRGSYNVAADGVFYLSQAIRRAGRIPAPVLTPLTSPLLRMARAAGFTRFAPFELDYLRFPWLVDTARLRDEMGFRPRWTGADALRSFARAHAPFGASSGVEGDES
jgi:UDP-glucose 4-epimerase